MALRDTWHRGLAYFGFGVAEGEDLRLEPLPEPEPEPEAEIEDRYRERPNMLRPQLKVRSATAAYAPRLSPLLHELGYPSDERQVTERLTRVLADPAARVFVAEEGGTIMGFAAVSIVPLLQGDRPLCRLTAIAVAPGARGRGLGRSLVEKVEDHVRGLGCDRLEVTSAARREDAHAFYERLGFAERPHRFLKAVSAER